MIVEGPNAPQADMQPQVPSRSRGECWVSMQSWERVYGSFKEKGPPSSKPEALQLRWPAKAPEDDGSKLFAVFEHLTCH